MGPPFDDRAWVPCPSCGVPDAVMRDQETLRPIEPPPLVAEALECLMCAGLANRAEALAEEMDPEGKRLPPWVRVVPAPAPPMIELLDE